MVLYGFQGCVKGSLKKKGIFWVYSLAAQLLNFKKFKLFGLVYVFWLIALAKQTILDIQLRH